METFWCHQLRAVYDIYDTMRALFQIPKSRLIASPARQMWKVDSNNRQTAAPCFARMTRTFRRACHRNGFSFHRLSQLHLPPLCRGTTEMNGNKLELATW